MVLKNHINILFYIRLMFVITWHMPDKLTENGARDLHIIVQLFKNFHQQYKYLLKFTVCACLKFYEISNIIFTYLA